MAALQERPLSFRFSHAGSADGHGLASVQAVVEMPANTRTELIDAIGQEPEPEDADDAAEIIDEFKDFIEDVGPEDFQ